FPDRWRFPGPIAPLKPFVGLRLLGTWSSPEPPQTTPKRRPLRTTLPTRPALCSRSTSIQELLYGALTSRAGFTVIPSSTEIGSSPRSEGCRSPRQAGFGPWTPEPARFSGDIQPPV